MAFRLAKGDILCNLDADNYAGEEFGKYVIDLFRDKGNICLTGLNNRSGVGDAMGKVCVWKQDFEDVTGYDESFVGYGYEDFDLVNRLALHGVQPFVINQPRFLKAITHTNSERLVNQDFYIRLHSVYIRYINAATSTILFLFKNGLYQRTTIIHNFQKYDSIDFAFQRPGRDDDKFDIDTDDSEIGEWHCGSHGTLQLTANGISKVVQLSKFDQLCKGLQTAALPGSAPYSKGKQAYHPISEETLINDAAYFVAQISNRTRMAQNLANANIRPNAVFGKGRVTRNFDERNIIEVSERSLEPLVL
ncbi:MAG: hypothetical protein EOP48_17135 [Sphingobacteriales bacterium]|nr:MAG: hypothetical protein EOP48_17135 [Sphingobacteriales bacterium]